MAPVITRTQLENAARDADDLGTIVNGTAAQSPVTTRFGGPVKTVKKLIEEAEAAISYAKGNAVVDGFIGNGVATAFALTADPGTRDNVQVIISGVVQRQNVEAETFTLTYPGSVPTITFVTAPPEELDDDDDPIANVEIRYGSAVGVNVPANDSVGIAKLNTGEITLYNSSSYLTLIQATAAKTSIVDADTFYIKDSADSNNPKWLSWLNLKTAIQTFLASLLHQTGELAYFDRLTAPAGWLVANGGTIGNASSGGTARANADTLALFTLIWTEFDQTARPVTTSTGAASTRGASAAADYAANKRIPLPDPRGRVLRALDLSKGIDTGRALGSVQDHQLQGHKHIWGSGGGTLLGSTLATGSGTDYLIAAADIGTGIAQSTKAKGPSTDGTNGTPNVGTETRMTNYAAVCCIKL